MPPHAIHLTRYGEWVSLAFSVLMGVWLIALRAQPSPSPPPQVNNGNE